MSVESVRNFFKERNQEDPVFELEDSGATVDLAAQVIGVEAKFIAKTLAFKLKEKDILVVTRGDARIDNKKFRTFFKTKAKMLDLNEVEEVTGHPVGGVCPFGLKNPIDVYVDVSIKDFDFVYPAAGSRTTALKISPESIQGLTNAEWVDVCQE
ncbi:MULTISPECIES: YbaK/EbsC family protein [Clostridium]|uniref:YbaK/prolyl-tRNA synthetase n=2 Tax=Clostridium TaxID=1485 RepID=A0A0E3M7R0_CLOSL|nr:MULTISPECIES: YbaK/EbsC family protein [Clostridium]AKA67372.1 YbaK/prolyl-tRNA synthetase [Clostridium scatologenes]AWI06181.1 prolyl-tRNA editing protein [Clostridium drakei]